MTQHTRREFARAAAAALAGAASTGAMLRWAAAGDPATPKDDYQVGAYYFGNYHVDPRNEKRYGQGWTEWELVKAARPRFAGHRQPRVPAWGYTDEADPRVMEQKIDAAADHGLDYWIFDWYYYDDGPFLQRSLEQGYFGAANNRRLKFCCMWANHDWVELFPAKRGRPRQVLYPGTVTRKTFDTIAEHVVAAYFKHPSHFAVEGCPYFSVYDLGALMRSFGGVEATRQALDHFRARTKAAGFPDLHLNAVYWGNPRPPDGQAIGPADLISRLGFDSVTSYVWVHHVGLDKLQTDYGHVEEGYFRYWDWAEKTFPVPYYPNVSVGWDSSPRTDQSDEYGNWGYPFTNTIAGNTPERFAEALAATKKRLDERGGPKILNINSWNEWTEGSYLEPDTVYGMQYLEAVRKVFG